MHALQVRHLSKRFDRVVACRDISFQVAEGGRHAIVGANGAGKSTLLRLIAGLEAPDAGSVWIDGRDVSRLKPAERGVAYVSQDYPLYPQLSVEQNLAAALQPLSLPREILEQRIASVADWFQLAGLERRRPDQLSGGQAQRVALAKALVRQPRLLLLDEPLSQLDSLRRPQLRGLLRELTTHFQTALLLVTHDATEALQVVSHLTVLDGGSVVQTGSADEVYRFPRSGLSAELLSPFGINWLPLSWLIGRWPKVRERLCAHPALHESCVGLRPEDIRFAASDGATPREGETDRSYSITLTARVTGVQSLGFAKLYEVDCAGQAMRVLCARTGNGTLAGDDPVELLIEFDRLLLGGGDSG